MIRRFARPYAKALTQIAGDAQEAKRLQAELQQFEQVRRSSLELQEVFLNPGVEAKDKMAILETIATKLELSAVSKRILEVLLKNHRLNDLGPILEAWREMLNQSLGVVVAKVRSAHALSEDEKASLTQALARRLGKKVEMDVQTDPSLLAGFIAEVGSEVFDASVTGQIHRLREKLA